MIKTVRGFVSHFKPLFVAAILCVGLSGCSTNPATGQQQFTALMSPQQEAQVGANEHANIMKTYGTVGIPALESYVSKVGAGVAANTERGDVRYQFFVLDDPMVNAFALPGGYVYVTRGLLAQANSEAELAAVLGHEIGHVTGRHSAERYSRGVVTSIGAAVLSAALDSKAASQALGVGSDLFMKSYSREQESEADGLGLRYMTRAGYNPKGMPAFLTALEGNTALESRINGKGGGGPDWFSTHPLTANRIQDTLILSQNYSQSGTVERDSYLSMIDGMTYGDSEKHGFARGNVFYHPKLDFTFAAPQGFEIVNQPEQVIARDKKSGAAIILDAQSVPQAMDARTYMQQVWMKGEALPDMESIDVNGMEAATAGFTGTVGGRAAQIRIVAVKWSADTFFRFQFAIPQGAPAALTEDLKRTTYSLRRMSAQEKRDIHPYKLRIVTARAGDSIASLANGMPFNSYREERFRALNALMPGQGIEPGARYKVISDR